MQKELKKHFTFIQGIVDLLHPFVEGVVHDLHSGTLAAIFNNISQRKVGDPTPLHELNIPTNQFPDYFPPYYKSNWDGRKLKCISMTIRDHKNAPIGLICFNLDVSLFQDIENRLSTLLQLEEDSRSPVEQFGTNWKEQVHLHIDRYLSENQQVFSRLTRSQKRSLIQHLYAKGLFNYKNAASLIADILGISRASLYNYLKE
ncbi:MAG: Transcriptional regulator DauR [Chlamydiales bacterium]|nr:Transcriptional regulator DauR [Chlamydiales bacterium]